jgi:hypothetical protein
MDSDEGASPGTACEDWQDAFCDYDRECGPLYDCRTEVRSVLCKSVSAARRCASALGASPCSDPPDGCSLEDIADVEAAAAACRTFIRRLCDVSVACGTARDQCEAEAKASLDCSVIDVVAPSYDRCLDELGTLSCTTIELPESCVDVFDNLI